MKRLAIAIAVGLFPFLISAQQKAVENLFNRYQGIEGVTTVMIGPEMFQVMKSLNIEEIEGNEFPVDKLTSVRILSIEDNDKFPGINFYEEVRKDLELDDFTEVMTVNDGNETVRMWMKNQDTQILEFLLIVGGGDNVLIYITGNFNMNDIEGIAESLDQDIDI
ncbi:MAG: DUF4252 domain-containing protein [Bacteroidales bacterium]|nr:DUF4252 domain-containing protein [Bacteroidales bacterium]